MRAPLLVLLVPLSVAAQTPEAISGGACDVLPFGGAPAHCSWGKGWHLPQLELEWRSSFLARPDRLVNGVGKLELVLPFGNGLGLFTSGAATELGVDLGELGLRAELFHHHLLLAAFLGFEAEPSAWDHPWHSSPEVGFALEWRM